MTNSQSNHTIITVDEQLLSSVKTKITEMPKLLHKSASKETCCIFKVPQSLIEINVKAYHPHVVSIGPYHHGKPHLKMIEEHKGRLLGNLIDRARSHGASLEKLLAAVGDMEERIRYYYSEEIRFNSRDLIQMIVLDGCFVIELFCVVGRLVPKDSNLYDDDPLFNMEWVFIYIVRDLLRLENQIPFFVLEKLYELSVFSSSKEKPPSLLKLALHYFNHASPRPDHILHRNPNLGEAKHLLDLFRLSLHPSTHQTNENSDQNNENSDQNLIPSAKKLQLAGVHFKAIDSENTLDIKFNRGVLEIPTLTIDDFTSAVFLNCIAFEQCYKNCSKHVTSYNVLMGCLMNTPSDASLLSDCNIIENCFGTNEDVARFFKDVGKDVAFDFQRSYLLKVVEDVNKYRNNGWHVQWAGFKHTYFDTTWSFLSALAAVILLVCTFFQVFFAFYAYFRPPKQS